ncbi:hypothetical protein DY000_02047354 [Brassica cretica]|uniref:Uncharacterized protein n=1 Tax=Brassica cretica TaxID=69181 RepID=A0ABQ7ERH5_BRACR|nr:hypothetical protein DY000_02047354 [Brassica cretica]
MALHLFHMKLKLLKSDLRALNQTQYGDITGVLDIWNHLATIEEMFYKQKSCVKWLEVEDMNTPFFHQEVQSRNARNAIKSLHSSSREVLTNASAIKKEAVDHFQRFLQTQPDASSVSLEEVQELLSYRCSDSKALDLVCRSDVDGFIVQM